MVSRAINDKFDSTSYHLSNLSLIALEGMRLLVQNFSVEIISANSCARKLITYCREYIIGLELQIISILLKVYCRQTMDTK